jgi:hypothetical protein
VPLTATTIINDRGRRVRAREVAAADLAEEDSEPGALVLRNTRDYMILVGQERDIGTTNTPLAGHVAFAMADDMSVASSRTAIERTAADAPSVYVGDTGPVSDRPLSRVTSIPFDPAATAAVAFYVSGESNGRDSFDAMVGPGVTFHLGDVAQELSLGLRGSAPTNIDLQALLSNPLTSIAHMQNGWFISHRVTVRVWEFGLGSLSFIARAQVDDGSAGLGVMGWAGISITAGDAAH